MTASALSDYPEDSPADRKRAVRNVGPPPAAASPRKTPGPLLPLDLVMQHGKVHFGLFCRETGLAGTPAYRALCSSGSRPAGSISHDRGSLRVAQYLVIPTPGLRQGYELWRWIGRGSTHLKSYDSLEGILDMAEQMVELDSRGVAYDVDTVAPRSIPKKSEAATPAAAPLRLVSEREDARPLPPLPRGWEFHPSGGFQYRSGRLSGSICRSDAPVAIVAGTLRSRVTFRVVDLEALVLSGEEGARPSGLRPIMQTLDFGSAVRWANRWPACDTQLPQPRNFIGDLRVTPKGTVAGYMESRVVGQRYAVTLLPHLEVKIVRTDDRGYSRNLGTVNTWTETIGRLHQDAREKGVVLPMDFGVVPQSDQNHPWFDYHRDMRL